MDEGEEVDGAAIVACGAASEVFELVEAAFDAVAQLVDGWIVGEGMLAGGIGWNDGFGAAVGDDGAQSAAVVGGVGDDVAGAVAFEAGPALGSRRRSGRE